jgi:hypothetical protein
MMQKNNKNNTFPSTAGTGSAQGLGLKPPDQALMQQPSQGHEQLKCSITISSKASLAYRARI